MRFSSLPAYGCLAMALFFSAATGCDDQDAGCQRFSNAVDVREDSDETSMCVEPIQISLSCGNPTPILQRNTNVESGFVRCDDDLIIRTAAVACVDSLGESNCEDCVGCSETQMCRHVGTPWEPRCECRSGCRTDEDCGEGKICACAGVADLRVPQCIRAGCDLASDCSGGGLCALSVQPVVCGETIHQTACLDNTAQCRNSSHCPEEEGRHRCWSGFGQCSYGADQWSCDVSGCGVCG